MRLYSGTFWFCDKCGWEDRDTMKEKIRQEVANERLAAGFWK